MVKRTHILIISLALVSLIFGSLLYTNIAVGKVPQDQPTSKLISVLDHVYFENLPSSVETYHELGSFDTEGYKYAYVMVQVEGTFQYGANIMIFVFDNAFGVQTLVSGHIQVITYNQELNRPNWGTGSAKKEIHSPTMDLYLQMYNSDVGFDGFISIAVHLSN